MSIATSILSETTGLSARRIKNQIIWEGTDITQDISGDIISLSGSDSLNEFDTVDLTLQDRDSRWITNWKPQKGETIEFAYTLTNWDNIGVIPYKVGKFYIDSIEYQGPPDTVTVKTISVDTGSSFMEEKQNQVWLKVKLQKIAQDIASKHGYELIYQTDFNREFDRIEQKLESDFNFLKNTCKDNGIEIKLYNNKLTLFEENKYESKEPVITLQRSDLTSYRFTEDDTDTYAKCTIKYYDSKLAQNIEVTYTPKERKGYKSKNKRVLYVNAEQSPPGTTKQAKESYLLEVAKKELENKTKHTITAEITMIGKAQALTVGDTVNIVGFGDYAGKYLIKNINTEYKNYDVSISMYKIDISEEGGESSGS